MICDQCETVARCLKNGCVPCSVEKYNADLDHYSGVVYATPQGMAVYDVHVVKWLLENRSADYWAHMAQLKENT